MRKWEGRESEKNEGEGGRSEFVACITLIDVRVTRTAKKYKPH